MITNGEKPRWFFYPEWVVLNAITVLIAAAIAWALVSVIASTVGGTIQVLGQDHITEDFLLVYVLFPIIGILTGLTQYALLHRYLRRKRWWVAATVLGWLLPFVVGALFTTIFNSIPAKDSGSMWAMFGMPLIGAIVGLPQWWVLRQQVRHAAWWILANGIAWGTIGLLNTQTSEPLAILLAMAIVPAIATSSACWLLLGWSPRNEAGGRV